MSKQGTIIVVDDNKGVLSAVKLLLKNHFEHIVTLPSPITLPLRYVKKMRKWCCWI